MTDPAALKDHIEKTLGDAHLDVKRFFEAHYDQVDRAVYASSDVRDAGFKAVSVDANAFPAGFNNLCPASRASAVREIGRYFHDHHPEVTRILLLPEDHTRNPYYIENVRYLSTILAETGIDHTVGSPNPDVVYGVQGVTTPSGETVSYDLVTRRDGLLYAGGEPVDFVLSNNDFTDGVPKIVAETDVPILPIPRLGWNERSKGKHFALYNGLARGLAHEVGLDPWHLTVDTVPLGDIDFKGREGLDRVGKAADDVLERMRTKYDEHGIDAEAKVFVKDDAGTYGMGMKVVTDGEEIVTLNSRGRQKMDKGKYGHKVDRVIVQEAVPTTESVDGHAAEPVVYMIRGRPVGAFMRIHPEKGAADNLNQPGMRFQPICQHRGCHDEGKEKIDLCLPDAEHIAAELSSLALSYEATGPVLEAADPEAVAVPRLKAP